MPDDLDDSDVLHSLLGFHSQDEFVRFNLFVQRQLASQVREEHRDYLIYEERRRENESFRLQRKEALGDKPSFRDPWLRLDRTLCFAIHPKSRETFMGFSGASGGLVYNQFQQASRRQRRALFKGIYEGATGLSAEIGDEVEVGNGTNTVRFAHECAEASAITLAKRSGIDPSTLLLASFWSTRHTPGLDFKSKIANPCERCKRWIPRVCGGVLKQDGWYFGGVQVCNFTTSLSIVQPSIYEGSSPSSRNRSSARPAEPARSYRTASTTSSDPGPARKRRRTQAPTAKRDS